MEENRWLQMTASDSVVKNQDDEEFLLIDGDTEMDADGNQFRHIGTDTREIASVKEDKFGEEYVALPQQGANLQTEIVEKVIKDGGFNNVKYTGEYDIYDRELIERYDDSGRSLSETLIAAGLSDVNVFTKQTALDAKLASDVNRQLKGERGEYADLSDQLQAKYNEQGILFKTAALNEAEYDPKFHSSVQFRDHDRNLANEAIGFFGQAGAAMGQSWQGIKEGFYGYAEALGENVLPDAIADIGTQGVARARQRVSEAPSVLLDYREVDSIMDGFQYVMNNAAMSAPYLGLTLGSMALSLPFGGIAGAATGSALFGSAVRLGVGYLPNSVVYAGQIWNEMEGPKNMSQFAAASAGGVAAAVVERIGARGLIGADTLLSTGGINKVARALVIANNKKIKQGALLPKITIKQATEKIVNATRREQAEYALAFARLKAKDIRNFSALGVLKRIGGGAAREGITEILQESIQMGTAQAFSEKEYEQDNVTNRLLNAGIAGSVLGGGFSAVGTGRNSLKDYMLKKDIENTGDQSRLDTIARYAVERQSNGERLNSTDQNINMNDAQQENVETNTDNQDIEAAGRLPVEGQSAEQAREQKKESIEKSKSESTLEYLADKYKTGKKGLRNFFTQNDDLYDYVGAVAKGTLNLFRSAERAMIKMERAILDDDMLDVMSRIGGSTTGRFFSGDNFKSFQDKLLGQMASEVNKAQLIKRVLGADPNWKGGTKVNTKNVAEVSKRILEFARDGSFKRYQAAKDNGKTFVSKKYTKEEASILYEAGLDFDNAYRNAYDLANDAYMKETKYQEKPLFFDPDAWYKQDGFDWQKVKQQPDKFKKYLKEVLKDDVDVDRVYQDIIHRGQSSFGNEFSMVGKGTWTPFVFSEKASDLATDKRFKEFRSDNLFETTSKMQKETSKYVAATKFFGHGGRKLDFLFRKMREKAIAAGNDGRDTLTLDEIDQAAYYAKAIIDSSHGNFNRIEDPRLAALNSFLTSWSIMSGLTLATLSSIPETAMVFFKVNSDPLFKKAVENFNIQVSAAFDKAAEAEVQKHIKMLDRSGFSDLQNAVVDRFATGERDISFLRAHEVFFRTIGITQFTQFQRRMNAGFAIDYLNSNMLTLSFAPTKTVKVEAFGLRNVKTKAEAEAAGLEETKVVLNFDKMNEQELRIFNHLTDLGIDVQGLLNAYKLTDELYRDSMFDLEFADTEEGAIRKTRKQAALNSLKSRSASLEPSQREVFQDVEKAEQYIDSQIETAVYNFVNERVMNPQAANRPLFFQDPHYQLLTQFNGFISTYTAQVLPQLYRNQLAKGTMQVKYDTFSLIVMLMLLGGASQYLKDKIKFGKPSPYLDGPGYIQRALYSSGILGQYERVFDAVAPLYPSRDDNIATALLGETGPSARNISNVVKGIANIAQGEGERGANSLLKSVPLFSTINQGRKAAINIPQGKPAELELTNPLDDLLN